MCILYRERTFICYIVVLFGFKAFSFMHIIMISSNGMLQAKRISNVIKMDFKFVNLQEYFSSL